LTNNKFFDHTHLITGASGGMIGAGFYRENKLMEKDSNWVLNKTDMLNKISKDLLNPLAFSIATTDMFIRLKRFSDGNYEYTKDRGWFFEKSLVDNFGLFNNKRMIDYTIPEFNSKIPMLLFSPSVVNDGRRILISSQPISFMCYTDSNKIQNNSVENLEFNALFNDNSSMNLRMTSALRMNATFPYILPMVLLPTEPSVEVMDAGVRDNFGLSSSISYIQNFKHWISDNTSGVIVVQIRDKEKNPTMKNDQSGSLLSKLFTPLTNVYSNFLKIQDYKNDLLLNQLMNDFEGEVDYIEFAMGELSSKEISMSWHLTTKDKVQIYQQLNSEENQLSIKKIQEVFLH